MKDYDLEVIDAKLLASLRHQAMTDAPWASWPERAWEFLAAGTQAGLRWCIHPDFLAAYLKPEGKTKASQRRQADARKNLRFSHEAKTWFPSGVGLFARATLGYERSGDQEEGEPARMFVPASDAPAPDHLLVKSMAVFWPDIPSLVWDQVRGLLCHREEEMEADYGTRARVASDYLDFGRLFRFLDRAGRLSPQPVIDWAAVIDPPPGPATTRTPRR